MSMSTRFLNYCFTKKEPNLKKFNVRRLLQKSRTEPILVRNELCDISEVKDDEEFLSRYLLMYMMMLCNILFALILA